MINLSIQQKAKNKVNVQSILWTICKASFIESIMSKLEKTKYKKTGSV